MCALAVVAGVDYLFTHDRGYLREGLRRFDVEVLAPDEFLAPAFDADPRGMLDVLELQSYSWAEDDLSRSCSPRSIALTCLLWLTRHASR